MASNNCNSDAHGSSTAEVTLRFISKKQLRREMAEAEAFWREERRKRRTYDRRFLQGIQIAPLGNIRKLIDRKADDDAFLKKLRIQPL
ncbi:MAG TPA: hypothetical protein VK699_05515 [Terriglobales bacterium]|jgi:hypothetical protein|nr:hypothetical protein [Terriglobales bacterium]